MVRRRATCDEVARLVYREAERTERSVARCRARLSPTFCRKKYSHRPTELSGIGEAEGVLSSLSGES